MDKQEPPLDHIGSIRFSSDEWTRLMRVAKAEDVSVSSLVRTGAAMVLDLLEEAHGQQDANPTAG